MAEHATQAIIGWGTQIQYGAGDGPPETFTTVHDCFGAEPPDEKSEVIPIRNFESPGGAVEKVSGMTESQDWTVQLNWRPDVWADHRQILADKIAKTKRNWRIVLPGGMETISTPAMVTGLKRGVTPQGVLTMDVTLTADAVTSIVDVLT